MANTEKENLSPVNNESAMDKSAKAEDTVQVFFPCVHGEASGQLVTVSCFQANELKGVIKVVSGIDDETARRIIGATRYSETHNRAASGVIAFFSNPLFGGESYGLALALADKMILDSNMVALFEKYDDPFMNHRVAKPPVAVMVPGKVIFGCV